MAGNLRRNCEKRWEILYLQLCVCRVCVCVCVRVCFSPSSRELHVDPHCILLGTHLPPPHLDPERKKPQVTMFHFY